MGKILETTYHDAVEQVTSFYGTLLDHSFYELNDKRPTLVTYYNINKDYSSLDPGAKIAYDNIGDNTPLRFTRIENFIMYGINRIELQTEIDDFGIEAAKIEGDAYILPCSIIPKEGDYFEIDHITDSNWLFIVTDIQQDTLKNGSNAYKIQYKLEYTDHERILNSVIEDCIEIDKKDGTDILRVVVKKDYEIAKKIDKAAVQLKSYFNELFYNPGVQTFTYVDLTDFRAYDPYMIEYIIRNKILDNGIESYIHVMHQIEPERTFAIDYDKTIFRAFETRDLNKLKVANRHVFLEPITSYGTTFSSRYETYFKCIYVDSPPSYATMCLEDELYYRILDRRLVTEKDADENNYIPYWENILIKYFSREKNKKGSCAVYLTDAEITSVETMPFDESSKVFYLLPLLIQALEWFIEEALK